MRSGLPAPKFRRQRCVECGAVVPWSWLTREPRKAVMKVDDAGHTSVRCLEHVAVAATHSTADASGEP